MQAGEFNLRFWLEKATRADDGCGGHTVTWQPLFQTWGKIVPLSAALIRLAENERLQLTHYIYIRKRDGIEQGMRFVKGSRIFIIQTIMHWAHCLRFMDDFLQLKSLNRWSHKSSRS